MNLTQLPGAVRTAERAAERADDRADHAVVVALHSSGAGARQWAPWRAWLTPGTTLIAPDLLGYDAGAAWPADRAVTLDEEADRVARLLEAFPQGVHLVGHSYGGAVALRVALRWPRHVRRLSLYEPVLFGLLRDDEHGDDGDVAAWRAITGVGHGIGALARSGQVEAAAARFVDYWSGAGAWTALPPHRQQAIAARMPKVSAEFDALFGDPMPPEVYRQLRLPMRLAGGDRSPEPARRIVARLARLLPGVQTHRMTELGHMGPLEAPQRVADAFGLVPASPVALRAA
jgi:pimeloyl-ACP methyl ester carboxylesterase